MFFQSDTKIIDWIVTFVIKEGDFYCCFVKNIIALHQLINITIILMDTMVVFIIKNQSYVITVTLLHYKKPRLLKKNILR